MRELGMLLQTFHEGVIFCCLFVGGLEQQPSELACGWQRWGSRLGRYGRMRAMGMDPLRDEGTRPPKALLSDLPPQTGLIGTPLGEAGLEVGHIRIDFPSAPVAALIRG
jgi:hypothetical protein